MDTIRRQCVSTSVRMACFGYLSQMKKCRIYQKTLSQNRWKNVELFPVALSDANSTDQLMITNSRNTGSAVLSDLCSEEGEDEVVQEKHTVDTKSLSRLLNERDKKRIDLLKIDVESAKKISFLI